MKLKVIDSPGLVRDSKSKAIVAEDREQYNKYIQGRNFRDQVNNVNKEIGDLKSELSEIKVMLSQLLSNR